MGRINSRLWRVHYVDGVEAEFGSLVTGGEFEYSRMLHCVLPSFFPEGFGGCISGSVVLRSVIAWNVELSVWGGIIYAGAYRPFLNKRGVWCDFRCEAAVEVCAYSLSSGIKLPRYVFCLWALLYLFCV